MYIAAWYVALWLFITNLNLSKLQVRDNTISGPVYGHVPTMVGGMCCVLHCTPLLTIPAGVCLRSICKLIVFVGADINIPTLSK